MDFSTVSSQIESTKKRLENLNVDKREAKQIIVELDTNDALNVRKHNTTNDRANTVPLDRQKFEELLEGYEKCSVDDLEVGNFIRYKYKKDGVIKYVHGGMLVYKCQNFLRVKNVKNNITWSVKLCPSQPTVFYQKRRLKLDDGGVYVNLNTASTTGLLATVIDRGDFEALEKAARLAKKNMLYKNS